MSVLWLDGGARNASRMLYKGKTGLPRSGVSSASALVRSLAAGFPRAEAISRLASNYSALGRSKLLSVRSALLVGSRLLGMRQAERSHASAARQAPPHLGLDSACRRPRRTGAPPSGSAEVLARRWALLRPGDGPARARAAVAVSMPPNLISLAPHLSRLTVVEPSPFLPTRPDPPSIDPQGAVTHGEMPGHDPRRR